MGLILLGADAIATPVLPSCRPAKLDKLLLLALAAASPATARRRQEAVPDCSVRFKHWAIAHPGDTLAYRRVFGCRPW